MPNPCKFCNANCCKTYTITTTIFDILRISKTTGKKPEEFALLHEARLLSYDPDLVLNTLDGYGHYLLGIKSHPCIFLEKNKCIIHNVAPMSCKRYPYTTEGNLNARFCSFMASVIFKFRKPDIDAVQLKNEIKDYKKIVFEWDKKPGKKDECIDFLIAESKKL